MAKFDYLGARNAGWSDNEIAAYLTKQKNEGNVLTIDKDDYESLNQIKKQEKLKGLLERTADVISKPFEAVSGALFSPIVETLAKPIGETVANVAELSGNKAPEWAAKNRLSSPQMLSAEKQGYANILKNGVSQEIIDKAQELRDKGYKGANFTDIVNVLSLLPGGGAVVKGAETLAKGAEVASGAKLIPKALQAVKTAAPTGAKFGVAYGLAGAADKNKSLTETATDTALGALSGAAVGTGMALVGTSLGGITKKVSETLNKDVKIKNIVNDNISGLTQIEDNNAAVRKVITKAKERGIDSKTLLAQTDLLKGAVDNTGTLRTTQEGGAISQLQQDVIKPVEDVISKNLLKEGKTISIDTVEQQMVDNINNSGIKGADKVAALDKARREAMGLRLEADDQGNIPIAAIHDAKTYKYSNIDYLNPASKNTDKIIAKTLKEIVEQNTDSVDVKALNQELAQHFSVLGLLEKLDGKKVAGGKLGKYFSQTIGSIVGSHFGPLGAIIGAEVGGGIRGAQMSSKFNRATGKKIEQSPLMKKALEKVK